MLTLAATLAFLQKLHMKQGWSKMQYETMDIFYSFYSIAHGTLWYCHYIVGGHESNMQEAVNRVLF